MEEMWIAGVAKENYSNFCEVYKKTLPYRKNKKTIIFGAGIMGLQFGYAIKALGDRDFLFCDNNSEKWGKEIAGRKVISPTELRGNKDKYFVFLAMERYEACALQLEELGYCKDVDWTNLSNYSEKKLIEDFQKDDEAEIVILGDCAANVISLKDEYKMSLAELLYDKGKVKVLALNGLYMRAYYNILLMCLEKMKDVKKIVLLLDAGIFQEKFCYYSGNQHVRVMEALQEISRGKGSESIAFLEEARKRECTENLLSQTSPNRTENISGEALEKERKMHMRLNYLFPVKTETESFRYLELFVKECVFRGVEMLGVIMPVNNEMGEGYFGGAFYEKYEKISKEIADYIEQNGGVVSDLSYALKHMEFISIRSTNEGMTADGRNKVARMIKEKL